ncbi:MAG: hypothetical protein FJX77_12670, partial [Armatimonadetes bacterium]|nr:hypothetical protein [Armatimonadota bacterium]
MDRPGIADRDPALAPLASPPSPPQRLGLIRIVRPRYPERDPPTDLERTIRSGDFDLSFAYDDNGHGTHVAGIIAGNGAGSFGQFMGMAPEASLIGLKVLDRNGRGNAGDLIDSLYWCVQNKAVFNIRVINLSLGHDAMESHVTDPICVAVRHCVANGIVVVCSAGNKGKDPLGRLRYGGISTPAVEPSALTIGALNTRGTVERSDDLVCTFSSRGPTNVDQFLKPDLLAPGNRIVSLRVPGSYLDTTFPQYRVAADNGAPYFSLSGTSMAAPQ